MHETKRSPCPHGARREKLEKERRSMLLWHHRFLAWGTFHAPSTHSAERTSFLGRTPQISMKFGRVLASSSSSTLFLLDRRETLHIDGLEAAGCVALLALRPVLAATSGELSLNPLAFLGTVLARAVLDIQLSHMRKWKICGSEHGAAHSPGVSQL